MALATPTFAMTQTQFQDQETGNGFGDTIGWNPSLSDSYETGTAGSLDYASIHPPKPDMASVKHPNLTNAVLGQGSFTDSLKSLANYWAAEIGDNEYTGASDFAGSSKYQNVFRDDTQGWRDDWGNDMAWSGASANPDDWKFHGNKRSREVDLPFMTEVEGKFKDLEVALGYNSNTDLIGDVFPGYSGEVDEIPLQVRGDNPEIVIGDPDEETGELKGGELVGTPEDIGTASGSWGQYLTGVKQIKETYTEDKKDAKEDYQASLKSVRAQKQALGGRAETGLREQVKKGSLTGFRRGGRRAGGFRRGDTASLQAQASEIGGLREKARTAYRNKLDRLVLDKKQDIEGKANILKSKVETVFTGLAGDVKVAENTYQSDHLDLEDERSDNIYDIFQLYEQADTAPPWPRDPSRTDEIEGTASLQAQASESEEVVVELVDLGVKRMNNASA